MEIAYLDHPLAEIFPIMTPEELAELADDITANQQRAPVMLYEGKILDGRNRSRACLIAGVECVYEEYRGDDPLAFVVSQNMRRRQLTPSQRAVVAAKIADMKIGRPEKRHGLPIKKDERSLSKNEETAETSQNEAAHKLHVSPRAVRAVKAIERAAPEKIKEIQAGTKTVHAATVEIKKEAAAKKVLKVADLPKDERGKTVPAKLVELWSRREEISAMAKEISKVKCAIDKGAKDGDKLFLMLSCQSIVSWLEQVFHSLQNEKPCAVCPMCQGQGCRACKNVGIIGKHMMRAIPSEFKDPNE